MGEMLSRVLKGFMLILSMILLASAFLPVRTPNPPRSLMLLGSGLVMLAGVTRRHYADEE
jgi:NADH:ubiquinone oxidoreductase subunit 6 (subunit J)